MTANRSAIPLWQNQKITIHTDGSCLGNPGPGGWAYVLRVYSGDILKMQITRAEHVPDTTNNQVEVMAAINAFDICPPDVPIELFTDSTYVSDGCMKHRITQKANDWRKSNNKPIANKESWIKLDGLLNEKTHKVIWVQAHVGNEFNEIADGLARSAAEGFSTDEIVYFDDEGNPISNPLGF